MTMSDPIADMLTRIRNANSAKHDTVEVSSSKMKLAIAKILLDEGYIRSYELVDDGNFKNIKITLNTVQTKTTKLSPVLRESPNPVFAFTQARMSYPEYSVVWA